MSVERARAAFREIVAEQKDVRLGRVVSVSGSQAILLLDGAANGDAPGSAEPPSVQLGTMVKMHTPISTVYALVASLRVSDPEQNPNGNEMRIVELELLGEAVIGANGKRDVFGRGVSIFPALGDGVYASTKADLVRVYARPAVSNVRIGTIHQDRSVPAFLVTDELLGKHFAILGTTGTGKSCTVALILQAILSRHANGHVLLLDPHNEYAHAFGNAAEVLDTSTLQLPYWLLTFDEFIEIMFGSKSNNREPEIAILGDLIVNAKRKFLGDNPDGEVVTVDTPVPYLMGEMMRHLDEEMGRLDRAESTTPYARIKTKLISLQSDHRYAFMFPGLAVRDNMVAILSRIFRIPVDDRPVTIMDLSGVPSEILNVVVSVLARMTFDFALWSDRTTPILLVCEEAHRYIPGEDRLGFETSKKALSRIAKEGRKYGVSLCLVSQRPSELASSVLSQCSTIFAMRLSNQNDQDFVRAAISESAKGLLNFLPSLRNAEAIAVGEAVSVPVRVCLEELPDAARPLSGTASFSSAWESDDPSDMGAIVARWRRQRR